jgi:hypothetical protein
MAWRCLQLIASTRAPLETDQQTEEKRHRIGTFFADNDILGTSSWRGFQGSFFQMFKPSDRNYLTVHEINPDSSDPKSQNGLPP